jgi:tetratricopeptide (TPR) repeat protein
MDFPKSRRLHEESLAIRRREGDRPGEAMSLNNLGNVAYWSGDLDGAQKLQLESLAINREIGDQWGLGWSLRDLGRVMRAKGEFVAARSYLDESLRIRVEIGDQSGIAESLETVGMIECSLGRHRNAVHLLAASQAIRDQIMQPISPPEQRELDAVLRDLRESLGEEDCNSEWEEGYALTLEEGVAFALRQSHAEKNTPPG